MIIVNKAQVDAFTEIISGKIIIRDETYSIPKGVITDKSADDNFTIAENKDLKKYSIIKMKNGECTNYDIEKETYHNIMKILQQGIQYGSYKEEQLPAVLAEIFESNAIIPYKLTK